MFECICYDAVHLLIAFGRFAVWYKVPRSTARRNNGLQRLPIAVIFRFHRHNTRAKDHSQALNTPHLLICTSYDLKLIFFFVHGALLRRAECL